MKLPGSPAVSSPSARGNPALDKLRSAHRDGEALLAEGKSRVAVAQLRAAMDEARRAAKRSKGDAKEIALCKNQIRRLLGEALCTAGDEKGGTTVLEKALMKAHHLNDDLTARDASLQLGIVQMRQQQPTAAAALFEKAIKMWQMYKAKVEGTTPSRGDASPSPVSDGSSSAHSDSERSIVSQDITESDLRTEAQLFLELGKCRVAAEKLNLSGGGSLGFTQEDAARSFATALRIATEFGFREIVRSARTEILALRRGGRAALDTIGFDISDYASPRQSSADERTDSEMELVG